MFDSTTIPDLVKLFERRNTRFYHACQFVDFVSYSKLGGIPSRSVLEQYSLGFTPFDTDQSDRDKEVWDKVFLNLTDFGAAFAKAAAATPNAYGPILLILPPRALSDCLDVAICLRSAGAQGFDREQESLRSLSEVHDLFVNSSSQWAEQLKYGELLSKMAGYSSAANPEVSCSAKTGTIPLSTIMYTRVDPYTIAGVDLLDRVATVLRESGSDRKAYPRNGVVDVPRYNELAELILSGFRSDQPLPPATSISLSRWWDALNARKLVYQFDRYATYLRVGTLQPLLSKE